MNPFKVFTKNERELLSKLMKLEDRAYTKDETKKIQNNIFEEIFSKSYKSGEMHEARLEYNDILYKLEKIR